MRLALAAMVLAAGCLGSAPTSESEARLFTDTAVFPGTYDLTGPYSRVLNPGPHGRLPDEFVTLESRLGGTIRIGIIRPDVPPGTRVPIIARAAGYGTGFGTDALAAIPDTYGPSAAFSIENFVAHGYALAYIGLRGTSGSEGCGHWRDRAADIDQALTWLGGQPWSNGRIGMDGFSYAGGTQWMAAGLGNPYLRTIVPTSGVLDRFHEYYKNGSGPAPDAIVGVPADVDACDDGRERAARQHSFATGERDPGGYWDDLNEKPRVLANYTGSVFVIHGLGGDLPPHVVYPWIASLEARGIVVKHLLGQWGHRLPDAREPDLPGMPRAARGGPPNAGARADWAETLLRWYDHWLKDEGDAGLGSRIQVQDSAGQWRQADAWPHGDPLTFHLAPGALSTTPSTQGAMLPVGPDATWSAGSPVPFAACPTCQAFATEPLAASLHFTGLPRLHVTVVPLAESGHLTAYLYQLDPGPRLLGDARMNLAFADGGETARPFDAGAPLRVRMELDPMDVAVPEGARLFLVVSQGRYGSDSDEGTPMGPQDTAPVLLDVGPGKSTLTVLAFQPRAQDLFQPPLLS